MNTKLKVKRIEKMLSQSDLANKIGVTSQSVSDYERGRTLPKYENMKKIAEALDCRVGELFFGED